MRYARLARAAGFNEFVKLEVIGDERTPRLMFRRHSKLQRLPADEGFKVMAYTNDDLITALRLEDVGCVAVMPLASPIGSGLGVVNPYFIREIKSRLKVPVIVDAGVGTASDACVTMEQGVDGVLMNTALASADDPVRMSHAMKHAVVAGRLAYLAGRMLQSEMTEPQWYAIQQYASRPVHCVGTSMGHGVPRALQVPLPMVTHANPTNIPLQDRHADPG